MAQYTITFSDRGELGERSGWTSFWEYYPELTLSLGNRFYSFKDGQLWIHNDETNPKRGVFYDHEVMTQIKTVLNNINAEDKIFKTMVLESNDSWKVEIETNYTKSTIEKDEFKKRESKYYAHIRKNENTDDYTDRIQGVGVIDSVDGNTITFTGDVPALVNVGETLVQLDESEDVPIGSIISAISGKTITLSSVISPFQVGRFCFSVKNPRIQGSEIRGYYAEVALTNNSRAKVELFAINSNIVLSYTTTEQK